MDADGLHSPAADRESGAPRDGGADSGLIPHFDRIPALPEDHPAGHRRADDEIGADCRQPLRDNIQSD